MSEQYLSDVLHGGMQLKFYVPVEDCPEIERFAGNFIRVRIGAFHFIGELKKVSTWTKKEKKEVVGIYKEISLLVEQIFTRDEDGKETAVALPDPKDMVADNVYIQYVQD
jgi:hypothetical protein